MSKKVQKPEWANDAFFSPSTEVISPQFMFYLLIFSTSKAHFTPIYRLCEEIDALYLTPSHFTRESDMTVFQEWRSATTSISSCAVKLLSYSELHFPFHS